MSKYSICVLDDKIPVKSEEYFNDTTIIDTNSINYLISNEDIWEDKDLLELIKSIKSQNDWEISGFTNHEFFLNYINRNIYNPDIIIFDWDVDGTSQSSVKLSEILMSTYCLVVIYTKNDNEYEVNQELSKSQFKDYKDSRLFFVVKNESDSIKKLEAKINEMFENNFSFKYSKELKLKLLCSLNKILSNLGAISFDQFVTMFGENNREKTRSKISSLDFTEIITNKLFTELLYIGFDEKILDSTYSDFDNENIIRKIWHFRLYHQPKDDIVRKGDIVIEKRTKKYYLIISSDCHLSRFWQKNIGYLSMVPLYKIDNEDLKKRLNDYNFENLKKFKITSMINPCYIENITILPGVYVENETYFDLILSPKEIRSIEIKKNKPAENQSPLKYSQITKLKGKDRLRISEPFLTPLIDFILKNITNYGVPDYSNSLNDIIKDEIRGLSK